MRVEGGKVKMMEGALEKVVTLLPLHHLKPYQKTIRR